MKETSSLSAESIVVSLELAKELKEAGWPQNESVFCVDTKGGLGVVLRDATQMGESQVIWNERFIAAPTAEEFLRNLPDKIADDVMTGTKSLLQIQAREKRKGWHIFYFDDSGAMGSTLANAAAIMWLHLKCNNLLR